MPRMDRLRDTVHIWATYLIDINTREPKYAQPHQIVAIMQNNRKPSEQTAVPHLWRGHALHFCRAGTAKDIHKRSTKHTCEHHGAGGSDGTEERSIVRAHVRPGTGVCSGFSHFVCVKCTKYKAYWNTNDERRGVLCKQRREWLCSWKKATTARLLVIGVDQRVDRLP